jgi:hypothetical protein
VLLLWAEAADFLDDRAEQGRCGQFSIAAHCLDEALLSELLLCVVEGFGDAVGVENQGVAGGEAAFPDLALPAIEQTDYRAGGIQRFQSVIAPENERGKVPAVRVAQAPRRIVVFDEEQRCEGPGRRVLAEKLIDGLQQPLRLLHRKGRVWAARIHGAQVAQVRLKIRHQQRRGGSFAGNVTDHEAEPVAAERKEIVVIPADGPGLHAEAAVFERAHFGLRLRKESRLHLSRGFQFQRGHVFGFESLSVLAALLLDFPDGRLVFD